MSHEFKRPADTTRYMLNVGNVNRVNTCDVDSVNTCNVNKC